jgi:F0F1-type ATP synthase assembly protein I
MMKHHKLITGVIMLLIAGVISGGITGYILGRYYSPEPQSLRALLHNEKRSETIPGTADRSRKNSRQKHAQAGKIQNKKCSGAIDDN